MAAQAFQQAASDPGELRRSAHALPQHDAHRRPAGTWNLPLPQRHRHRGAGRNPGLSGHLWEGALHRRRCPLGEDQGPRRLPVLPSRDHGPERSAGRRRPYRPRLRDARVRPRSSLRDPWRPHLESARSRGHRAVQRSHRPTGARNQRSSSRIAPAVRLRNGVRHGLARGRRRRRRADGGSGRVLRIPAVPRADDVVARQSRQAASM